LERTEHNTQGRGKNKKTTEGEEREGKIRGNMTNGPKHICLLTGHGVSRGDLEKRGKRTRGKRMKIQLREGWLATDEGIVVKWTGGRNKKTGKGVVKNIKGGKKKASEDSKS